MVTMAQALLDQREMDKLVLGLAEARGDTGLTESDAAQLLSWAREIRFWNMAILLTLRGKTILDWGPDGPIMRSKP